jgi:spore germination cell wall hydrolase CwlJ-like protein
VLGSAAGLVLGATYVGAGLEGNAPARGEAVRVALSPQENAQPPSVVAAPDAVRMTADAKLSRARELNCLTQAVYFEARGESARGQQAVATVIMNRVKNPSFPKTVCGVVYQHVAQGRGCQFSFTCDGKTERVAEPNAWDRARRVAARVLSGAVLRDVGSATHFHAIGVAPGWGPQMRRVAQVGLHVFYRLNPHAPRPIEPEADDEAVFVSAPAPAKPELRLAEAIAVPVSAVAAEPAAVPTLEIKPAAKPQEAAPAKAEAPMAAKPIPVAATS